MWLCFLRNVSQTRTKIDDLFSRLSTFLSIDSWMSYRHLISTGCPQIPSSVFTISNGDTTISSVIWGQNLEVSLDPFFTQAIIHHVWLILLLKYLLNLTAAVHSLVFIQDFIISCLDCCCYKFLTYLSLCLHFAPSDPFPHSSEMQLSKTSIWFLLPRQVLLRITQAC